MSQTIFGPVNITFGNTANFVLKFLDSDGVLTTPSSAYLEISYVTTSNVSQTDTVSLSVAGSFLTGSWSTSGAAYGIATWVAISEGSTTVQQTGTIRVIGP